MIVSDAQPISQCSRTSDIDAQRREVVLGFVVVVRGIQQSCSNINAQISITSRDCGKRLAFGRNAANVQAGAAQRAELLNACGLQPQLSSLDGSDVACQIRRTNGLKSRIPRVRRIPDLQGRLRRRPRHIL